MFDSIFRSLREDDESCANAGLACPDLFVAKLRFDVNNRVLKRCQNG
jgi:hypothetical protein